MYECPNCGGNLRFDISLQQLKCDHCETHLDPYQYQKEQDAEEQTMYDVTVFTCPQCGGEIISTDTSATGFCSFCGASTILDSRLQNEKRPRFIIPFKKTKEDCKEAYKRLMRHAIFAPKELKDIEYIDRFRGIYMPYWLYIVDQKGNVTLKGKRSYRRGDYILTDHYNLSCRVDASYKGLSYDASSSFDDTISETIAPYHAKEVQIFAPSILCGFYADIADVGQSLYEGDACLMAEDETIRRINSLPAFSGYNMESSLDAVRNTPGFYTNCTETDNAMYPVWFLTYRKKDRVAYAIMNGQTGKISADIPVDEKKYILGSVLLAIPIFLLLNFSVTLKPTSLLLFAGFLALLTGGLYEVVIWSLRRREHHDNDKGFQAVQKKEKTVEFPTNSDATSGSVIKGLSGSIIALILALVITLLHPVSDLYYYAGTIVAFLCICFTILGLLQKYNLLATRPLPHFNRKGGDDRA